MEIRNSNNNRTISFINCYTKEISFIKVYMKNELFKQNIKQILDKRLKEYNQFSFVESDPIQVPHKFFKKEDIEIASFLTTSIAWGQRKTIIKNAYALMDRMDNSPFEFVMEANTEELKRISAFVHRTFNGEDCMYFIKSLRNIYQYHGGLEKVFTIGYMENLDIKEALAHFRALFLSIPHPQHVNKHISDVNANSAAKRLNLMLRWLVRKDENDVDFGLWKNIPSAALLLPLDVHAGNVGRELGILTRKQNDWKAVEEITEVLREFDANDPVKYDFALFGIGVFDKNHSNLI